MTAHARTLNEITQQAIELLSRELGIEATVRFLGQFTTGYGNYTEERDVLFEDLSLNEALDAMKSRTDRS